MGLNAAVLVPRNHFLRGANTRLAPLTSPVFTREDYFPAYPNALFASRIAASTAGNLLRRPLPVVAAPRLWRESPVIPPAPGRIEFTVAGRSVVRTIHELITPEECRDLLAKATAQGFEGVTFDRSVRDAKRLHTTDPDLSKMLLPRLRPYVPELVVVDGARWRLHDFTHHWRYVRYEKGGHFVPHYDGAKLVAPGSDETTQVPWRAMTVFTVQIYLNGDFTGGRTRFYMNYKHQRDLPHPIGYGVVTKFDPEGEPTHSVEPAAGKALVFNHALDALHDAEPVEGGVKFILRGDLAYVLLPEDLPLLKNPSKPPEERIWDEETARLGHTKDYAGQTWKCQCGDDFCGIRPPVKRLDDMRIILINGKRATGKDYVSDRLEAALSESGWRVYRTSLGRLNKRLYARKEGADLYRLEHDRAYKELHRLALVAHHAALNREDPGWALTQAIEEAREARASVLILSDLRTPGDLEWLRKTHPSTEPVLLRIDASDQTRLKRGWDPDSRKDNLHTETGMDRFSGWTARFDNSADSSNLVDEWVMGTVIPRLGPMPATGDVKKT